MKHPDSFCNKVQADFLDSLPPEDRRLQEILNSIGNATYGYYQQAKKFQITQAEWVEWLNGLPDDIRKSFQKIGFEESKNALPFKRYILEKNDLGLDEYLREHLSDEVYNEYQLLSKS